MKVRIIPFAEEFSGDFARLNYEWLKKYFVVEPHDVEMLEVKKGPYKLSKDKVKFDNVDEKKIKIK